MIEQIGVVVVNHNGGDLTLACLHTVLATSWPPDQLQVVLVDNGSTDGIAGRVRRELPAVEVRELGRNAGFGAACNVGIASLTTVDAIALVNNDATVESDWLAPLVSALDGDPSIGAACPKILLADRYRSITLRCQTSTVSGDPRPRGVLITGARVDDRDAWPRTRLAYGFWGTEAATDDLRAQWSRDVATVLVPGEGTRVDLLLSATNDTSVELSAAGVSTVHRVTTAPSWCRVEATGPPADVINNVGTIVGADGYGADRGYLEPDDGRYDEATDVDAWCGGAVLLRRSYLDDVGPFDERLFVYYEDVDLSQRGAAHEWRYRYVPHSEVRHVHNASSGHGSAFKQWHDDRNHLVVLARHAPPAETLRASAHFLVTTGSYVGRDLVRPVLAARRPRPRIVGQRLSAFASFVRLLPATLQARRHDELS